MRFFLVFTVFSFTQAFIQIGKGVRPENLLVKLLNEVSSKTKTTMADSATTEEILTTILLTEPTETTTTTTEETSEVELATTTESEQQSTETEEVVLEVTTEEETTSDAISTKEFDSVNSTTIEITTESATATTTTTESGKCQDQFSRCHGVRFLCENILYRKIMTTVCAKTCGFCHQFVRLPMPERCIDHHPKECEIWGDNGFCHAYFYTMPEKVENCMKTCGLC